VAAVAATLVAIVIGLRLQDAAISPEATPAGADGSASSAMPSQQEGTVNVPKTGYVVQGADPTCQKNPDPDAPHGSSEAVCRDVVVRGIPPGSRLVSTRAYVKESGTGQWWLCTSREGQGTVRDCGIEHFRFLSAAPTVTAGPNEITVTWTAMNWSAERSREAQVLVQYQLPTQ
jgi:hypothetical protein